MRSIHALVTILAATVLLVGQPAPTEAQSCPPFLCYVDLITGGTVCPNGTVYSEIRVDPLTSAAAPAGCDTSLWKTAVVKVDVPAGCKGVSVWVEYDGEPMGWTLDVGDSATNNGFGGDAGSTPAGQNAELQILNEELSVFGATSTPPTDRQVLQTLSLKDGGFRVNVEDQFVSWGQGYTELATPDFDRLFFLPEDPVGDENRTLYVGLNRVIQPTMSANPSLSRGGCGLRRALLTIR